MSDSKVTNSYSWTNRKSTESWQVVWRFNRTDLIDNDWKPYCRGSELAVRAMYEELIKDPELREKNMIFAIAHEKWSWELTDLQHVPKEITDV